MFGKIKWTFYGLLALILAAFLHYTLPQRDIVRIVGTYEERQDFGGWNNIFWSSGDAGTGENTQNRDVLFIQTVKANGKEMVFRNEDTGWFWPPYLKFDTADLQTKAADSVSPKATPEWYAMRHYGWRSVLLSSFPNALSLKPVEGPNVTLIPWFNIIFLIVVFLIAFAIWRRVDRWKDKNVDPYLEDAGEFYDEVTDTLGDSAEAARTRANEAKTGLSKWLDSWKSKKR